MIEDYSLLTTWPKVFHYTHWKICDFCTSIQQAGQQSDFLSKLDLTKTVVSWWAVAIMVPYTCLIEKLGWWWKPFTMKTTYYRKHW